MSASAKSTMILDRAAASGLPATYVLGNYATRVTFHAQQTRAFNLIWALFDQKVIAKGSRVCIIGGGLAGMTAAAAANIKECKVTLYESGSQLMERQRGNSTRYIHPNIYDWPQSGSEKDSTDLPCLNWKAAKTEQVIEQIEQEWALVDQGIDVKTDRKISKIVEFDGKPQIIINKPFDTVDFDCVILATGFGLERPLSNVPLRLYWDTDNLHQRMNWPTLPKNILVSGCGDGGLIDILRLKLVDFKHERFTADFLENDGLNELKKELVAIDDKAPSDPAKAALYYFQAYKKLDIDDSLKAGIRAKIRKDTAVTLNSSAVTPLNAVASTLNRFAVFLLIDIGELTYLPGKITNVSFTADGYTVIFNDNGSNVQEKFDDVIVRHGPEPVIQDLVPAGHVPVRAQKKDPTAQPQWSKKFYPKKTIAAPKESKMNRVFRYLDQLQDLLSDQVTLNVVGVGGTKASPVFSVFIEESELPASLSTLTSFQSIPIKYTFNSNVHKTSGSSSAVEGESVLRVGRAIRRGQNGPIGTLGCFITLSSGLPGFISTSHVLEDPHIDDHRIFATGLDGGENIEIGELYRPLQMGYNPERANRHDGIDAAVVLLKTRVPFATGLGTTRGVKTLKNIGETRLGERVFKIGAGSSLTAGTVRVVNAQLNMGQKESSDTILVEGLDEDHFSSPGDSGAIVFNTHGVALGMVVGKLNQFTIVIRLKPIMDKFDIRLFS